MMPTLNFQKQFAAAVESGEKRQTIRAPRKRPIRVGDTLYLYTCMRTKACRKLGEAKCISSNFVTIDGTYGDFDGIWHSTEMRVANRPVDIEEAALADGFPDARRMLEWFEKTHGLPFYGYLIQW